MSQLLLDHVDRPSLEMTATYPSKLLFSWFDEVMYRGWKHSLEPSDMYSLQVLQWSNRVMFTCQKGTNKLKKQEFVFILYDMPYSLVTQQRTPTRLGGRTGRQKSEKPTGKSLLDQERVH